MYAVNSSTSYDSFLTTLHNQNLIDTRSFSLYLNAVDAENGQLVFGGVDTAKYSEGFETLPNLDPINNVVPVTRIDMVLTNETVVNLESETLMADTQFNTPYVAPRCIYIVW